MSTFKIVYRSCSAKGSPQGKLILRVIYRRKSSQISLGIQLPENSWNQQRQTSSNKQINKQLAQVRKGIEKIVEKLSKRGEYTAQEVLIHYRSHIEGNTLLGFTQQLATMYSKRGQERTARAYLSAVKRLLNHSKNPKLKLSQITYHLIENFERTLIREGKAQNTISFYLRNLRAIYNKAVHKQQVTERSHHPFANIHTGIESTRKRSLTQSDISSLLKTDLSGKEKLAFARSLFLFCFHARGMSFVDMAYLKKSDLKNGIIYYRRKKTRQPIEVKLTPELTKLIDRLARYTQKSEYLLPIISRYKNTRLQYESALRLQNKRLSILGKMASLSQPLSTHVARHTWASMAKQINTPIAVISESLGHSNQKTTYTYLSLLDRKLLDRASEKVSRMIQSIPMDTYAYSSPY